MKSKALTLLLAAAIGTALCCQNLKSVNAAATLYGDTNYDGYVTLSDVITLNKFIHGNSELVNYYNADTNIDCIVDAIDADILMRFNSGTISSLPYTG